MNTLISVGKIGSIYKLLESGGVNIRQTARSLRLSRNTVRKYLKDMGNFRSGHPELCNCLGLYLSFLREKNHKSIYPHYLFRFFPLIFDNIQRENSNRIVEWKKYRSLKLIELGYTQFCSQFSKWCKQSSLIVTSSKYKIKSISESDTRTLLAWKKSSDKRKWEKAVVISESFRGTPIQTIASKVERSSRKIKNWIRKYETEGLSALQKRIVKRNQEKQKSIQAKKANLIKLIHESPKLHGVNRASWSLKTLSLAYQAHYGSYLAISTISEYIKSEGYCFRKAKETLTSPDPSYREKLIRITNILSALKPNEKFFSVDEFGPFAVKIQGGRSLVKKGEVRTYPQNQMSKGRIICTAALELSQNQITHFYSIKKNTEEMIKLLEILLKKYATEEKIYFSWDAASWHASKKLLQRIEEINHPPGNIIRNTPIVELAPLPASAQFLNVIESVFSGLAKAIIHNSNYQSVDECTSAIDKYFDERNRYFRLHPKKAGKKIWGKELNSPAFDESRNFKDPRWR